MRACVVVCVQGYKSQSVPYRPRSPTCNGSGPHGHPPNALRDNPSLSPESPSSQGVLIRSSIITRGERNEAVGHTACVYEPVFTVIVLFYGLPLVGSRPMFMRSVANEILLINH